MDKCMHCIVYGRVQGVNFRATTRAEALRLGISGWVRNVDTGEVELMAHGADTGLESLFEWLHKGPPAAQVVQVHRTFVDCSEVHAGFSIRT